MTKKAWGGGGGGAGGGGGGGGGGERVLFPRMVVGDTLMHTMNFAITLNVILIY